MDLGNFSTTTDSPNARGPWPQLAAGNAERSDHSAGLPPTSYDDAEWRIGWTDGRVGIETPGQRQLFEFEAERRTAARAEELRQAVSTADAEFQVARAKRDRARGDAQRIEEIYARLDDDRIGSPSSFSFPLGLFYLVIAFVLFIADLPLSLLAAEGIDIAGNYLALSDLSNLLAAVPRSWEAIAFATGIAALGLFFKFVADIFFKPKYLGDRRIRGLSVALLLAIVGLVVMNLIFLAEVRSAQHALNAAIAARSATIQTWMDAAEMWGHRAFICLTLTLPILGGICASAGWSRLQNVLRLRKLHDERIATRNVDDQLEAAYREAEGKLRVARSLLEHVDDLTAASAAAAHDLYVKGFVRGLAVPETIHGSRRLHERIGIVFDRWLTVADQRDAAPPARRVE